MTEDEILEEILRFIREYLDLPDVVAESDLFGSVGLDSIKLIEILTFVEERFGMKIPGDEETVEALATPRKIAVRVCSLAR